MGRRLGIAIRHRKFSSLIFAGAALVPTDSKVQLAVDLEENPNSRCIFNLYNFCFSLFSVWKTNKSWLKLKAELNDQLSDRQSCRQDSSELTRANTKLFHYVTAIIKHVNKQKQTKTKNNYYQIYEQTETNKQPLSNI